MNIDFQNGFLAGLALAYKRQAEGAAFGGYVFKTFVDTIILRILTHADVPTVSLLTDEAPDTVEHLTLSALPVLDSVALTLI